VAEKKNISDLTGTVLDILKFAIQREEEAARGYGDLARRTTDAGLKMLLLDLQADEVNHRKLLRELAISEDLPLLQCTVPDLKISDYLIEEPIGPDSRFQDILIFAAKKEAKAAELYERLMNRATDPKSKRLFQFLVQQEKMHKLKLEQIYEQQIYQEE
jgi:rubrerythrin